MTPRKRKLSFRKYPPDQLERVYRFLQDYSHEKGYMPSAREVAKRFSRGKFSTLHPMVIFWFRLMVEKKMIEYTPGISRSVKLLPLQETQTQEA